MIRYRNQKEALMKYVNQNREYFSKLDQETFQAALEYLYEEGIEKGKIRGMILAYRDMEIAVQEIAIKLMDKYDLSQEDALRMIRDCK